MDDIRQDVKELLIGMGELRAEFRHITSHNTTFRDDVNREIAKLDLVIYGNGNPDKGLVLKTERNTDFIVFWQKFGWLILAGFAGIPCTVVASICLHIIKGS